MRNTT
jgi:hypothetical protein